MQVRPPDLADEDVRRALRDGWGIDAEVSYAAVGFGSHHWVATEDAHRWFVTVDDLARRPAPGRSPREAFDRLSTAYATARALHASGLGFVVAPRPVLPDDLSSGSVVELDGRWAVAVLPYVEGTRWGFGDTLSEPERVELVGMLARLHASRTAPSALRTDAPPSGRDALDLLLESTAAQWHGGPYAEPARRWLDEHAGLVRRRLAELEAALARVDRHSLVVTHGEPHPGNLVGGPEGLRLVDWDTVAIAPRERDLWLVGTDAATVAAYEDASGHTVDRSLLGAFRLAWDLADVASFLAELHAPHDDTADTRDALHYLTHLDLAPL